MKIKIENYSSAGKVFSQPIGVIKGHAIGKMAEIREVKDEDFESWRVALEKQLLSVTKYDEQAEAKAGVPPKTETKVEAETKAETDDKKKGKK